MNELIKEKPSFHTEEMNTPYRKAKQEWDDRIGSARVQANNWRFIALILGFICALLSVGVVLLIKQSKYVVYVAEMGKNGQVVNVAPLKQRYVPVRAEYEYSLSQFIHNIMTIPTDPVVLKDNWTMAYQYVSGNAYGQLTTLAKKIKPFQQVGNEVAQTHVRRVFQVTPESYEVDWTQTIYNNRGQLIHQYTYEGTFTVSYNEPSSQNEIMNNPLGIKINYFNITGGSNKP